jgi:hypothetical protein
MQIPPTGQEAPLKSFFMGFGQGRLQKALPVSDDSWFAYILRFL